jgi:hypothetical protein
MSFEHYALAYKFSQIFAELSLFLRVSQHISQEFLVTIVILSVTILPLQFSIIVVKTTLL